MAGGRGTQSSLGRQPEITMETVGSYTVRVAYWDAPLRSKKTPSAVLQWDWREFRVGLWPRRMDHRSRNPHLRHARRGRESAR